MQRKMTDGGENNGKKMDFGDILELLGSKKYCEFMAQRRLCDGKCAECKKDVMDVVRGGGV